MLVSVRLLSPRPRVHAVCTYTRTVPSEHNGLCVSVCLVKEHMLTRQPVWTRVSARLRGPRQVGLCTNELSQKPCTRRVSRERALVHMCVQTLMYVYGSACARVNMGTLMHGFAHNCVRMRVCISASTSVCFCVHRWVWARPLLGTSCA